THDATPNTVVTTQAVVLDLNGGLAGAAFVDANANGAQNTADPALAGRAVYLDLNNNKALDAGEPTAVTNAQGQYNFTGVAPGTYNLRLALFPGEVVTAPTGNGYTVTVTGGSNTTGLNFADTITSTAVPVPVTTPASAPTS